MPWIIDISANHISAVFLPKLTNVLLVMDAIIMKQHCILIEQEIIFQLVKIAANENDS